MLTMKNVLPCLPCVSSATPGCAACAPATGAPSACVRISSTLSCCRWSEPNSTLSYSEGPCSFFVKKTFYCGFNKLCSFSVFLNTSTHLTWIICQFLSRLCVASFPLPAFKSMSFLLYFLFVPKTDPPTPAFTYIINSSSLFTLFLFGISDILLHLNTFRPPPPSLPHEV